MKKVLILANSIDGLYSFRKEVIKAIISIGLDIYISVPIGNKDKEDYFLNEGCKIEHQVVDRRGTNPINDIKLLLSYKKLIKKIKPNIVLTYTIKPNIYGGLAARFENVPQLANITGLGSSINNKGITQKIAVFLYKIGLSKATSVFYQNTSIKHFCQLNHIGKNGILLPGSGVDLDWHSYQEYPASNEIIKFLFIGRIMRDKGIDEFITMVKYIKPRYPNVEFHLLGSCEDNYQNTLEQLQKEDLLYWHGSVSDVRPFIKDSHCTIHPSYHEGMANVLLESCAAGRPIIASNINGCKEAIDNGINGFLCEVNNSDDLVEKVETFINLPHKNKLEMGVSARRKMETEFDRKIVINSYLEEIRKIIQ